MNLVTIIRDAKEGNAIACRLLMNAMRGPMMAVCRRYVKDSRDAEERVIDGFHKCFTNLPDFKYESEDKFCAWLKKIIIRECLMHLRKKESFILFTEIDPDEVAMEPDVAEKISAGEIFKMADQLPPGYRTIFNLNVTDGLEHKEIALLLGIKESTSRSRLTKAKVCLQKILISNGYNHERSRSILE
jgi:RNA polymerase sigma-70 factor (ECF subfamily)